MGHVYEREVDPDTNDSLAKIVGRIPGGSRVLDVGTGSGALGRFLQSRGCKVDGLTYSEAEARLAQDCYEQVNVVDLELVLPSKILDERYDVIVCADVLEHLRNAEDVLSDLAGLLTDGGRILLSIPNVTHLAVILSLVAGRFVRTQEGLLDATHVRFVDRTELGKMIRHAGLKVAEQMEVRRLLHETEFGGLDFAAIPHAVRSYLATVPDGDIYQFVWVLEPGEPSVPMTADLPVEIPVIDVVPRFGAQLYVNSGEGFTEEASQWVWGRLEEGPQTLRFDAVELQNVSQLRIDMSDRPGVFELLCLRLVDASGQVAWQWDGSITPGVSLNGCECPLTPGEYGGRVFRATTSDPFAIIPLPPQTATPLWPELVMTAPSRFEDAAFAWADRRYTLRIEHLECELSTALSNENTAVERCEQLQQALDAASATICWKIRSRLRDLRNCFRSLFKGRVGQ